MKFAREFKAAIQSGDFPEEWCQAAIPYPTLKKCLNRIRAELQGLGLTVEDLRQLLTAQVVSAQGEMIPLAKYNLDVSDSDVHPHFTIFVDLEDGVVVDASLSPASRAFLQRQAEAHGKTTVTVADTVAPAPAPAPAADAVAATGAGHPSHQRVEVSMTADSEFFQLIYHDMAALERIGKAEQAAITADVVELGKEVAAVARPERKRRLWGGNHGKANSNGDNGRNSSSSSSSSSSIAVSDLPRWRELFELYLEAQVFFSTRERDHGRARTAAQASRQLDWFQEQVRRRGLLQQFALPAASMQAYRRFLLLNKRLYLNLRFRELNATAQAKILKKFDKVTALGVSQAFAHVCGGRGGGGGDPLLLSDPPVQSMARDVCARIAEDVVALVPRLEDYTCPVCLSLAWLPVRLRCRHVFCVRCVIKMQREGQRNCPLCRGEVVMEADLDNLDGELEKFLKLYFRREAKEKQKANELERGVELFGQDYKKTCVVM